MSERATCPQCGRTKSTRDNDIRLCEACGYSWLDRSKPEIVCRNAAGKCPRSRPGATLKGYRYTGEKKCSGCEWAYVDGKLYVDSSRLAPTAPAEKPCPDCNGSGKAPRGIDWFTDRKELPCPRCGGTGKRQRRGRF